MGDSAPRCPIGGEMIDQSAARLNGLITVTVLVAAVVTPYHWLLAYLVFDFGIKVFVSFRYSPSCRMASALADALHQEKRPTDSAPKRLAAIIALVMSLLALAVAPYAVAYYAIVLTFLFFASLEAFAGFCVGCYLYTLLPQTAAVLLVRRNR